ncbi:MAG: DNA-protecting protein DprA [Treponema sp.]|nr:DNA-protecting protein DprA [Treponema sp.]
MNLNQKDFLLILSLHRISFLSLAEKIILLKKLDSFTDLALMSLKDISSVCNREIKFAAWDGKENLKAAEKEERILEAKKIRWLFYSNADYPALLREIPNAPLLLFYRGDVSCLLEKTVSVVGTRRITPEGKKAAFSFSRDACDNGITVVSGLANGVDSAAHSGAVESYFFAMEQGLALPSAKTVAVLPCACDTIIPSSNVRLAEKILNTGGALVSEYVPGVPSEPWRYVQRNRIIAALSPALVVIQAPTGSGALITAQYALEYNRDVMFHKACFCENAGKVNSIVDSELCRKASLGKLSSSKAGNKVEKYLAYGAPVIDGFADYVKCLAEVPGIRSAEKQQLELF